MIEVVKGWIGIIISPDKLDEYIKKGFVKVGEETVKEIVDEAKEDMTKYTVKELIKCLLKYDIFLYSSMFIPLSDNIKTSEIGRAHV